MFGISIHALREEGDHTFCNVVVGRRISIHALREEGDTYNEESVPGMINFYPRPPRGGRLCRFRYICGLQFHFYPRPPRGGRRSQASAKKYNSAISIHALREEGDAAASDCKQYKSKFLSTPSARRATRMQKAGNKQQAFLSTPSARRATPPDAQWYKNQKDFYPRPPRGGRPA